MGDGSWTGSAEHCVEPNNCSEGFGYQITSVQVAKGTYCGLRFTLKTDNPPYRVTRDINLMKNFEIDDSPRTGGITFNGPVMLSNGETRDSWFATTSNYETIMRVTKALKFLQSSCKPASPW